MNIHISDVPRGALLAGDTFERGGVIFTVTARYHRRDGAPGSASAVATGYADATFADITVHD